MRLSAVVSAFLIGMAAASPFDPLNPRSSEPKTICQQIGKKCTGSEDALCCDSTPGGVVGFAHCVNHKVKLTKCSDGCGSEGGVVQCIDNP